MSKSSKQRKGKRAKEQKCKRAKKQKRKSTKKEQKSKSAKVQKSRRVEQLEELLLLLTPCCHILPTPCREALFFFCKYSSDKASRQSIRVVIQTLLSDTICDRETAMLSSTHVQTHTYTNKQSIVKTTEEKAMKLFS